MNETTETIGETKCVDPGNNDHAEPKGWNPKRNEAVAAWLRDAGISTDGVVRVILDFGATRPPKVYIERLGSLKVACPVLAVALQDAEVWSDGKQTIETQRVNSA